jgi:hypothetical protein
MDSQDVDDPMLTRVSTLSNLLLTSYGSLLSSGRVSGSVDEALAESTKAHAATFALRTATLELLGMCSSLRTEAALAEVSQGSALSRGVWVDVDAAKVSHWLHPQPPVSALTFAAFKDFEQCQSATVVVDGGSRPTLFIKRASVAWLRASGGTEKTPEAWAVSTTSFATEVAFFKALQQQQQLQGASSSGSPITTHWEGLQRAGAPCVQCVHAEEEAGGVFTTVLHHLSPQSFCEVGRCGRGRAESVLGWLGAFHAYWWGRPPKLGPCSNSHQHPQPGGWWRAHTRPNLDYAATIPPTFASHCTALPAFQPLNTPRNHALIKALARHARRLHGEAAALPPITLLHGDVKTSNAFFPKQRDGEGGEGGEGGGEGEEGGGGGHEKSASAGSGLSSSSPPPTLFDFQWCGVGSSGLGDVAYFLAGGVEGQEVMRPGGVEHFLGVYRRALVGGLEARGLLGGSGGSGGAGSKAGSAASASASATTAMDTTSTSTSPEAISNAFDMELVLYYSTALPYLLTGLTPGVMERNRAKYGWLTHEQEEPVLAWLTGRVLKVLDGWEREGRLPM